jgi:hypothetical protein
MEVLRVQQLLRVALVVVTEIHQGLFTVKVQALMLQSFVMILTQEETPIGTYRLNMNLI